MSLLDWASGRMFKAGTPQSPGVQYLLGRPAAGPGRTGAPAGRHRAGDHLGRLQCPGLRLGRAEASPGRRHQPAAKCLAGTQAGGHPGPALRGLLLHVRPAGDWTGPARSMPTSFVRCSPPGRRATGTAASSSSSPEISARSTFAAASGAFAWLVNSYIDRVARLRPWAGFAALGHNRRPAARDLRRVPPRPFLVAPHAIRHEPRRGPFAGRGAARPTPADRDAIRRRDPEVRPRLRRGRVRPPAVADNYFWRGLHPGPLHPPVAAPNTSSPRTSSGSKAGWPSGSSVHTDSVQGFLEKNGGRFPLRAAGSHGLALVPAPAGAGAGMAMDRPPRTARPG